MREAGCPTAAINRRSLPSPPVLTCKCPRCGRGRLYKGYLKVAARCEACGADLSKADSGDGPAVFIIFILGAVVVPIALLFESIAAPAPLGPYDDLAGGDVGRWPWRFCRPRRAC